LLAQLLTSHTHRVGLQGLTRFLSGKEPIGGLAPAPVEAQQLQQSGRQHDLARELALALTDVDDHPLAVNIGDLQIQRFLTAKPCAVVQGQQCTVLDVHRRLKQGADFLTAPDGGQLAAHLGLDDLLIEPGLLQRPQVKELQR
jgi:hypothetical protein